MPYIQKLKTSRLKNLFLSLLFLVLVGSILPINTAMAANDDWRNTSVFYVIADNGNGVWDPSDVAVEKAHLYAYQNEGLYWDGDTWSNGATNRAFTNLDLIQWVEVTQGKTQLNVVNMYEINGDGNVLHEGLPCAGSGYRTFVVLVSGGKPANITTAPAPAAPPPSPPTTNAWTARSTEEIAQGGLNPNKTYSVVSGDTLGRIAQAFDTTVDALVATNSSITNPNMIYVGQVLVIP